MTAFGAPLVLTVPLFPPPSTVFCSPAKAPSLDSLSPLPWVLEQGRASSSFLPSFLGTETKLGGGDAGQGRGLSNHPATQNESVPMSPPIPREPGPQWEVDKWGDSLSWSKAGHSRLATCCQSLLATSHGSIPDYHVACLSTRSPSCELSAGACSGQMGMRQSCSQDPSFSSISGEGQGTWGCLCLQEGPQETMGAFLCWGW